LGRELIRRTVEAADGLVPGSPLTQAVVMALGGSLDNIMEWSFPKPTEAIVYKDYLGKEVAVSIGQTPKAYGDFSRMIFDYYEKGDPVARELVELELGY